MRGSGVIACVFDFDDTLASDSTSRFLESREIEAKQFWSAARALAERGFDPTLAWLKLFLDQVGEGLPLGTLKNADLNEFGGELEGSLFPGVATLFDDLRSIAVKTRDVDIEFYVVTGGLRELILGCETVSRNFEAVYGCELAEDDSGVVRHIARCVTFTEKTRYLFEISKGIEQNETQQNPFLVNKDVPEAERRIPFRNMVYVGDGLTDIPCFSLLNKNGGTALGVFDPSEEGKAKRALTEFLKPRRVVSMHSPRYGETDDLGAILRAAVATIASRIRLEATAAYG